MIKIKNNLYAWISSLLTPLHNKQSGQFKYLLVDEGRLLEIGYICSNIWQFNCNCFL